MEYSIKSKPGIFRGGTNIAVSLSFSAEERQIIAAHRMRALIIVKARGDESDSDTYLRFGDFYGRKTSWHADSAVEAKIFINDLTEGFQSFRTLLLANATQPAPVFEDFELLNFDLSLVPSGLWAEHTYILGESGGGKTQLIQTLLVKHREREKPPGFAIIDSQNGMLPLIKEKFPEAIHIDPENDPPHLDLFNIPVSHTDNAAVFRLMETFRYLFEAGGEPITGRQRTVFERGVALMFFGYPKGHGRTATIDDFEDFFEGVRDRKNRTLSENARKAVSVLPAEERRWYETEYQNFDSTCTEILQRLANICGRYSPLRPMLTKGAPLQLGKALDSGGIVLINTNHDYLQGGASAFMGRFFVKLIEQHMSSRNENSHPLFLIVDEVQEYFDSALMQKFPDQARKRNVACIFAHQRLAQIRRHEGLYEALTGVAVRFGTNFNDHDIKAARQIWHADSDEFITSQKREQVDERPRWADYALYVRGRALPQKVRIGFYQLDNMPVGAAPIDYDMHWGKSLHPKVARDGGEFSFHESDGIPPIKIRPGTKNGATYRVAGYGARKPDGGRGNLYVKFTVRDMPQQNSDDEPGKPRYIGAGDTDDGTKPGRW
jgi:hypothetical protein